MTPFEEHVRKYRPDSVTAKLSLENEKLRAIVRGLAVTINHCLQCGATWDYLGGQEKHRPGCLAAPPHKEKKQ